MKERTRLLMVPHVCNPHLRTRGVDFARHLAKWYDVYCLCWPDMTQVYHQRHFARRAEQIRRGLASLLVRRKIRGRSDGITYVSIPMIQVPLLKKLIGDWRALVVARAFNTRQLEHLCRSLRIQKVILQNYMFDVPPSIMGLQRYCDMVDHFNEDLVEPTLLEAERKRNRRLFLETNGNFVVSQPLADKLTAEYGTPFMCVPNGVDLENFRAVKSEEVQTLRNLYGLAGQLILGYIGNHGDHAGLDFLCQVYLEASKVIPNLSLLIVGPISQHWSSLKLHETEGVVLVGAVQPKRIYPYFALLDIGVLASEPTPFRSYAIPIKVLEYSAARRMVIASPLQGLRSLELPNVVTVERDVGQWVQAIQRTREISWQEEWDRVLEPYDWGQVAKTLRAALEGEKRTFRRGKVEIEASGSL